MACRILVKQLPVFMSMSLLAEECRRWHKHCSLAVAEILVLPSMAVKRDMKLLSPAGPAAQSRISVICTRSSMPLHHLHNTEETDCLPSPGGLFGRGADLQSCTSGPQQAHELLPQGLPLLEIQHDQHSLLLVWTLSSKTWFHV